jgi:hypothetical protein
MVGVVRDRLWQPAASGYVYRVTPGFAYYQTQNGPNHSTVVEDFVTTEAMGDACVGLLAAAG